MKRLLLAFLVFSISAEGFNTLSDIKLKASSLEEYPKADNDNYLNPDYTKFHKSFEKTRFWSLIDNVLYALRLKSKPIWTPEYFRSLLYKLDNRYRGPHVIKHTVKPGEKYVLWGDIQGAFHSFTRCLLKLNEMGIIDEHFKIADGYSFIFNGDLVDRSPHILETLTLAMRLIEVNPNKVFYILGNHEAKNIWRGYGLKRELKVRLKTLGLDEHIPLGDEVSTFFETLPRALYLKTDNSFVSFYHYRGENYKVDTLYYTDFLLSGDDGRFDLTKNKKSKKDVDVKIIVKGISRSAVFQPTDGLSKINPEKGATTWTMLSAPTMTYSQLYNFNNDAFSIIETSDSIEDWVITLYKQDARKKDGFKTLEYNFLSGRENGSGLISHKEPIKIGVTLDLSKTSANLGKRLREGIALRLEKENRVGGVNNRLLDLVVADDKYTPFMTLSNVEKFMRDYNATFTLSTLGTPTTEALLPKVKSKELLVLFPYTGASLFRKPELTNIINYRTSYANEANALITYAVERLNLRRFAFFYQDDSYGKAPLVASRDAVKRYGITEWVEVPYLRNEINVEAPAKKIRAFNPDVIVFYSTLAPSAELIRKIGIINLVGKTFMGISFLTDSFRDFLRGRGLELIMSRIVPNPKVSDLEIVNEYREEMRRNNKDADLSEDSLEGYINTSLLIEAMKSVKTITNESLISYFESIKNFNYKGLKLNFDPNLREFSKDIWIDTGSGEWYYQPARHSKVIETEAIED